MSLSMPGAPGVSMARRSMLRDGRGKRAGATSSSAVPPVDGPAALVVAPNSGRLTELADALAQIQAATGLEPHELATRLVEQVDPSSPIRPLDVFATGRADLVAAYLDGTLDGAALLAAWDRD